MDKDLDNFAAIPCSTPMDVEEINETAENDRGEVKSIVIFFQYLEKKNKKRKKTIFTMFLLCLGCFSGVNDRPTNGDCAAIDEQLLQQ